MPAVTAGSHLIELDYFQANRGRRPGRNSPGRRRSSSDPYTIKGPQAFSSLRPAQRGRAVGRRCVSRQLRIGGDRVGAVSGEGALHRCSMIPAYNLLLDTTAIRMGVTR